MQLASDRWPRENDPSDCRGIAVLPADLERRLGHAGPTDDLFDVEELESLVELLPRVSESFAEVSMIVAAAST